MSPVAPSMGLLATARSYWQLQQGDPYGGVSCTAYAAAAVIAWDTAGVSGPSGRAVRKRTDEPIPDPKNPGLTLAQVDAASRQFGVDLDIHYRIPWVELASHLAQGHAAVLQVSYGPIRASAFRGSSVFTGGHAFAVFPGWWVIDPLADGRKAGLYRGPGTYPEGLLREAAGDLVLKVDAKGHVLERVGDGYAYAAISPHARKVASVVYRFGGQPKSRGRYATTAAANVRSEPHVRPGTLVRVARRGELFYVAQRTDSGDRVAGSRRWYGDATGTRWVHSSLVREAA